MRLVALLLIAFVALAYLAQEAEKKPEAKDTRQLHSDFSNIDKNGDGFIDAGELRAAIAGLVEDDVTALYDKYDSDRDGVLTFEEYIILSAAN